MRHTGSAHGHPTWVQPIEAAARWPKSANQRRDLRRWLPLADYRSENDPADDRDDQPGNDTEDRRVRDQEHSVAHERARKGDA